VKARDLAKLCFGLGAVMALQGCESYATGPYANYTYGSRYYGSYDNQYYGPAYAEPFGYGGFFERGGNRHDHDHDHDQLRHRDRNHDHAAERRAPPGSERPPSPAEQHGFRDGFRGGFAAAPGAAPQANPTGPAQAPRAGGAAQTEQRHRSAFTQDR